MSVTRSPRLAGRPKVDYYKKIVMSRSVASIRKRSPTVKTIPKMKKTEKIQVSKVKESSLLSPPGAVNPTSLSRSYDIRKAVEHLRSVDPKLGKLLDTVSVDVFEERIRAADSTNAFRALATSIIYQQIHGKAAATIKSRFIQLFVRPEGEKDPNWFPTPDQVLTKSLEELRTAGLSARKGEYIYSLAKKFQDKEIVPEALDSMSDEELSKLLCSVKGIGQWTVDMFLMFNLGHPDVLPVTDLGIRKGMAAHFGASNKKSLPSPEEMRKWSEIWRVS